MVRLRCQLVHPALQVFGMDVAVELGFEQALCFGPSLGESLDGAVAKGLRGERQREGQRGSFQHSSDSLAAKTGCDGAR